MRAVELALAAEAVSLRLCTIVSSDGSWSVRPSLLHVLDSLHQNSQYFVYTGFLVLSDALKVLHVNTYTGIRGGADAARMSAGYCHEHARADILRLNIDASSWSCAALRRC